jgi:hypothetical protein
MPPSAGSKPIGPIGSALVRLTDGVAETQGADVVLIDAGKAHRLRKTGNPLTVVYEFRPKIALARRSEAGAAKAPPSPRTAAKSPAEEWMSLGFNCGGAALAWIGVVGMGALAPVTGGVGGIGAAVMYGGAIAASAQCAVSTYRTANVYTGRTAINQGLDNSDTYVWAMRGADVVGLIGAGGALKELKVAHSALKAEGFSMMQAARADLSRPVRRRLTEGLALQGGRRASGPIINRFVRQKLLDGAAGVIGLTASATDGATKDLVIWVVDSLQAGQ